MNEKILTYLLLGANLGDRQHALAAARQLISEKIGKIKKTSSLYETEPWGLTQQPAFLNQALEVETTLPPQKLLDTLLDIENSLGRMRNGKWEPRTIDIDILFYGNETLETPTLTIPHPQLHRRNFALIPMLEIAAEHIHPVLGKTIEELFDESEDPLDVLLFQDQAIN